MYGLGEKVLAFLKFARAIKKPENNHFHVPIHFATNRFTFEKFPPPPPLLHHTISLRQRLRMRTFILVFALS